MTTLFKSALNIFWISSVGKLFAFVLILISSELILKKPFSIRYKIPEGDSLNITQSFLAFLDKNGKSSFLSGDINEGYWEAKSKILGSFIVSRDSIAPEIRAQNFKNNQWLNDYRFLNFRISDDYKKTVCKVNLIFYKHLLLLVLCKDKIWSLVRLYL